MTNPMIETTTVASMSVTPRCVAHLFHRAANAGLRSYQFQSN